MDLLTGNGGSMGYCSGRAVVKTSREHRIPKYAANDAPVEIARFRAAQDEYADRLDALAEETEKIAGREVAEIFGAYREIVRDEDFFKNVFTRVENENISIEYAVRDECGKLTKLFSDMDDAYMRSRAVDVKNVCNELIRIMMGGAESSVKVGDNSDIVLVAEDLSPAETVELDKSVLRGIVTEHGGTASHTVILAKALGIPAIVGAHGATQRIGDGDFLLVDAFRGEVAINPDDSVRRDFAGRKELFESKIRLYETSERNPAATQDGFAVSVTINTGDPDSAKRFDAARNDGVGLLRTEFIYMGASDYPNEETQFKIYRDIAERAGGKEVVIRTLDASGDKRTPYMELPPEENPSLGFRSIRLCLNRPELFSVQLRAILRASAFGNVKIMFPMIVCLEELLTAREMLEQEKKSLKNAGVAFREDIPVGIMIETPAAVLLSDSLAREADFFSVGTNDLIQYTTASDRNNDQLQCLYDSCNISVLRAIRMVADNAARAKIPWGICGEAACERRLIPLWISMGVGSLSVSQSNVGRVKHIIRSVTRSKVIGELDSLLAYDRIELLKKRLNELSHQ